jgi:uncharacterized protein (DUF58 family)
LPEVQPLDMRLLMRLPSLPWRARYLMEGFLSGHHRSPFKGVSTEFTQYRNYQPGDDLRHLDWRLWGRTDRLFLRQYEEETRLKMHLVLDISASMSYSSRPGGFTKLDYARTILGALAMLMQRRNDAVGLALAGFRLEEYLRPRCSAAHLAALLGRLDTVPRGCAVTGLASCLLTLANLLSRRSLVVVTSDFYGQIEPMTAAIQRLRHDHHEVVAFHILDPLEMDFDFDTRGTFVDLESGSALKLESSAARERYLEALQNFLKQTEAMCRDHGVDYLRLRTDESPIPALTMYLAKREKTL